MSTAFYIARDDGEGNWIPRGGSLFIRHAVADGQIGITWTQLPGAVLLGLLAQAEERLMADVPVALIDEYGKTYTMGDLYTLCQAACVSSYEPAAIVD